MTRSASVCATFTQGLPGEGAGGFHKERFVQRRERLERRIGAGAADTGAIAVGSVEGFEHGVGQGTIAEGVEGAAVAIRTL